MPSFYLKQQEEVNTWRVSVFCVAAAPVISWNRKCSHYYMKHLTSVRARTLNPHPEIRFVLWLLMCRKHQSGKFIRPASSCIQTNKPYLQEACRSKATHAPPLSSHSPSTDDFTRGLGPHLCTDKTSKCSASKSIWLFTLVWFQHIIRKAHLVVALESLGALQGLKEARQKQRGRGKESESKIKANI